MTNDTKAALHAVIVWLALLPFLVAGAWAFVAGTDPVLDPRNWPVLGRLATIIYEAALIISAAPVLLSEDEI